MADFPTSVRVCQALGLTSTAVFLGGGLVVSLSMIPSILRAPTPLLLQQWSHMYSDGAKTGPPLAMSVAVQMSYVAYRYAQSAVPALAAKWPYFAAAAASMFTVLPFTVIVLMPTNRKLIQRTEETKALKITDEVTEIGLGDDSSRNLVKHWGRLNGVRIALALLAQGFALYGVLA